MDVVKSISVVGMPFGIVASQCGLLVNTTPAHDARWAFRRLISFIFTASCLPASLQAPIFLCLLERSRWQIFHTHSGKKLFIDGRERKMLVSYEFLRKFIDFLPLINRCEPPPPPLDAVLCWYRIYLCSLFLFALYPYSDLCGGISNRSECFLS